MAESTNIAEFALPDAGRWADQSRQRDRLFYYGLAAALLLHSSFLLGLHRAEPHTIGEENGSLDPIAVSLVTESEFRAQTAPATIPQPPHAAAPAPVAKAQPATPPAPPPEPEAQPEAQPDVQPEPPPEVQPEPQPAPVPPPSPATSADPKPAPAPEAKPEPAPADTVAALEQADPNLLTLPDAGEGARSSEREKSSSKPNEAAASDANPPKADPTKAAKQKPTKPAQQKLAKLEDSAASAAHPFSAPTFEGGSRDGAFARPPGITKSGWNDAFAKGVIRALQQTMPQMRAEGRVTIRILLDENGNVKSVDVIRPSPDALLTQSVVFAARQTSYPFPPGGATIADRTFLVTYIYR